MLGLLSEQYAKQFFYSQWSLPCKLTNVEGMWVFAAVSRRKTESVVSNPTKTDILYKERVEITTFILSFVRKVRKLMTLARWLKERKKVPGR